MSFVLHGMTGLPFFLVLAGFGSAFYLYMVRPDTAGPDPAALRRAVRHPGSRKYGFDDFNQAVFVRGSQNLGTALWKYGDAGLIDGLIVNGSARLVGWFAGRDPPPADRVTSITTRSR